MTAFSVPRSISPASTLIRNRRPRRSPARSAGYDFVLRVDVEIELLLTAACDFIPVRNIAHHLLEGLYRVV